MNNNALIKIKVVTVSYGSSVSLEWNLLLRKNYFA